MAYFLTIWDLLTKMVVAELAWFFKTVLILIVSEVKPLSFSFWFVPVFSLLGQPLYFFIPRAYFVSKCRIKLVQSHNGTQVANPDGLQSQVSLVVFLFVKFFLQEEFVSYIGAQDALHQANDFFVPMSPKCWVHPIHAWKLMCRHLFAFDQEIAEILLVCKV